MPANVSIYGIQALTPREPEDPAIRHAFALRRLGAILPQENGIASRERAVDNAIRTAVVMMRRLHPLEFEVWKRYLPDHEVSLVGFMNLILSRGLPLEDYLPTEVIEECILVQSLLVFHSIQFRTSIDVADVVLLGVRKNKSRDSEVAYMLAQWNAEGGPLSDFNQARSWLCGKNSSREMEELCNGHMVS